MLLLVGALPRLPDDHSDIRAATKSQAASGLPHQLHSIACCHLCTCTEYAVLCILESRRHWATSSTLYKGVWLACRRRQADSLPYAVSQPLQRPCTHSRQAKWTAEETRKGKEKEGTKARSVPWKIHYP